MKNPLKRIALLMIVGLALGACATKVERISPEEVKDLSGQWNDTDSRLVSEEMINDVVARAWLADFTQQRRRDPAVIVGGVRNLSHEHINVQTFVNDMERALINSGKVQLVASSGERQEIREERSDQDINASEETRNAMGKERGADFMLKGDISTILDTEGKRQVRFYQVDLTLISLADNRKVWVGQKKIKKYVTGRKERPKSQHIDDHAREGMAERRRRGAAVARGLRHVQRRHRPGGEIAGRRQERGRADGPRQTGRRAKRPRPVSAQQGDDPAHGRRLRSQQRRARGGQAAHRAQCRDQRERAGGRAVGERQPARLRGGAVRAHLRAHLLRVELSCAWAISGGAGRGPAN